MVGFGNPRLLPVARDEQRDVIVREYSRIGVDAEQLRRTRQSNPGLFRNLPLQRLLDRLATLDAPARKMSARAVGVAYEEDASVRIDQYRLRTERQSARQPPVALQNFGNDLPWQQYTAPFCATFRARAAPRGIHATRVSLPRAILPIAD